MLSVFVLLHASIVFWGLVALGLLMKGEFKAYVSDRYAILIAICLICDSFGIPFIVALMAENAFNANIGYGIVVMLHMLFVGVIGAWTAKAFASKLLLTVFWISSCFIAVVLIELRLRGVTTPAAVGGLALALVSYATANFWKSTQS